MGICNDLRKTNSLSSLHHHHHQQGSRKRLQSQSSLNKMSSNTPSNPQLIRAKTSTSDSLKVFELNDYQLYGTRRSSTYFTNGSTSSFYEHDNTFEAASGGEEVSDYKEHFRRTILQMYEETGGARSRNTDQYADLKQQRKRKRQAGEKETQNRLYLFIKYMATEQELLLQLFIFFPLILASLYIVFVEEKPLFIIT